MIPKIIHYCWFGRNPKPYAVLRYIQTWKDKLPDYEIKEWNEDNFDYKKLRYTREAYKAKKFAFVSDVARLFALYYYGGIYLDTDIIVCKSLNDYLYNNTFLGYEVNNLVGTGIIGAEKNSKWIKDFLMSYNHCSFITLRGGFNVCPNTIRLKNILKDLGCKFDNKEVILPYDIHIYPYEYFCAKDYRTGKIECTTNTVTIHDYTKTWKSSKQLSLKSRIYNLLLKL